MLDDSLLVLEDSDFEPDESPAELLDSEVAPEAAAPTFFEPWSFL